jgi:Ketopantoate reductase
MASAR